MFGQWYSCSANKFIDRTPNILHLGLILGVIVSMTISIAEK